MFEFVNIDRGAKFLASKDTNSNTLVYKIGSIGNDRGDHQSIYLLEYGGYQIPFIFHLKRQITTITYKGQSFDVIIAYYGSLGQNIGLLKSNTCQFVSYSRHFQFDPAIESVIEENKMRLDEWILYLLPPLLLRGEESSAVKPLVCVEFTNTPLGNKYIKFFRLYDRMVGHAKSFNKKEEIDEKKNSILDALEFRIKHKPQSADYKSHDDADETKKMSVIKEVFPNMHALLKAHNVRREAAAGWISQNAPLDINEIKKSLYGYQNLEMFDCFVKGNHPILKEILQEKEMLLEKAEKEACKFLDKAT